jgi:hypothetical protein
MEDFYFSVALDDRRTLCLAPLTERRIAMADQDIPDPSGYFLFEKHNTGEVEVIAQVLSEEAALRLRAMLNMS